MSTTPFTADSLAEAQGGALATLNELTRLDSDVEWSDAQAEIEKVRLNAAVVILSQQPPFDAAQFAAMFSDEEGPEAAVHTLETVQTETSGDFLDPHGAPPLGGGNR